jgi:hypothetical protein
MKKPLKEAMARPLKDILKQKIERGGRYILDSIRFFIPDFPLAFFGHFR